MSTNTAVIFRNAKLLGFPGTLEDLQNGRIDLDTRSVGDFRRIRNLRQNPGLRETQVWTQDQRMILETIGVWQPRKNTVVMGNLDADYYYFREPDYGYSEMHWTFDAGSVMHALATADFSNILPEREEYVENTIARAVEKLETIVDNSWSRHDRMFVSWFVTDPSRATADYTEITQEIINNWHLYKLRMAQAMVRAQSERRGNYVRWNVDAQMLDLLAIWKSELAAQGKNLLPELEECYRMHLSSLAQSSPEAWSLPNSIRVNFHSLRAAHYTRLYLYCQQRGLMIRSFRQQPNNVEDAHMISGYIDPARGNAQQELIRFIKTLKFDYIE